MKRSDTRVVKVGGSLLSMRNLRQRLTDWLARQPVAANVLIVGGGPLVEAIRHADRLHGLDPRQAHWLSIRAMSVTAEWIAHLLPDAQLITQWRRVPSALCEQRPIILDTLTFLRDVEPECDGERLPESWRVTSDSIAARVATVLGSGELVLLKSASPPSADIRRAAEAGYVDAFFPQAAINLAAIRCVDLSANGCAETQLHGAS